MARPQINRSSTKLAARKNQAFISAVMGVISSTTALRGPGNLQKTLTRPVDLSAF
jgi:hypothetical protein